MIDQGLVLCADIDTERIDLEIYTCDLVRVALSSSALETSAYRNESGLQAQDPDTWLEGFIACMNMLYKEHPDFLVHVAAVSMTGPPSLLIPIDNRACPIRHPILDPNSKADMEREMLEHEFGSEAFYNITGNDLDQFSAPAKLFWLLNNESRLYTTISKLFFNPKDYLIFLFSGDHSTDYTTASATGLFNVGSRDWEEKLLRFLHIKKNVLPKVVRGERKVGRILTQWAARLHLPEDTLFLNGLGHTAALALAADIKSENRGLLYSRKSAFVMFPRTNPDRRSGYNLLNYSGTQFLTISPLFGSGSSIEWALKTFFAEEYRSCSNIREIETEIEKRQSPSPILFLPYTLQKTHRLCTMKTRGAIFGLTLYTKKTEIVRAILEGVCFCFKYWFNLLNRNPRADVFMSGDSSMFNALCAILSSVMNRRIVRLKKELSSRCFGAAIAGLKHLEQDSVLSIPFREEKTDTIFSPDELLNRAYKLHAGRFESLYSELRQHLIKLSAFEARAGGTFGFVS